MSKNHDIHHIIGYATALFIGTQVNSAMADYGYGSLDELKAHWRGKPSAIPETFNRLWLDNNDGYIWQDSGNLFDRTTKDHRFLIKGKCDDNYSFDGKWELNGLPEKFGGTEAVRIYKALSSKRFLESLFGDEVFARIESNQNAGCPIKIVYKPQFGRQPFKDRKRIGLEMCVFQESSKGDIDADFEFIFEKTNDVVKMVALDGTVEIGSFDENHHRTVQDGHVWMNGPRSSNGSCSVFNGLRRLPVIYKRFQKDFNTCKDQPFRLQIKDIACHRFTGKITSPALLQITNQNFVRRKVASFLQVITQAIGFSKISSESDIGTM